MIKDEGMAILAHHIAFTKLNFDWKPAEIRWYFEERQGKRDRDEYYLADAMTMVMPGENILSVLRLYSEAGMSAAEMGCAILDAAFSFYQIEKLKQEAEGPRYDASQPRDFSALEEDVDDGDAQ